MPSRSNHVVANGRIPYLLYGWIMFHCIYNHNFFIFHPSRDIYIVSMSWLLWIILLWAWESRYLFELVFPIILHIFQEMELLAFVVVLFLIIKISMDGGACGLQSMGSQTIGNDWATSLIFNYWRKFHTVFIIAVPMWYQQCLYSLSSTYIRYHSLSFISIHYLFLVMVILSGMRWYLIDILICIS